MTALPEAHTPAITRPGLFGSLYLKMLHWAGHRHAERWLATVSFAESSFFPVPPDTMLIPMTLARPDRALRFALIATVFSVLGGILGYAIGVYGGDLIQPLIARLGWQHQFELVLSLGILGHSCCGIFTHPVQAFHHWRRLFRARHCAVCGSIDHWARGAIFSGNLSGGSSRACCGTGH